MVTKKRIHIKPLANKFAGHNRSLSLRQILRCWDVPTSDLSLLRRGWWQLLVLHFGLCHVVVTGIKVLLLRNKIKNVKMQRLGTFKNVVKNLKNTYPPCKSFPEKVWATRLGSECRIPGLQFGLFCLLWADYFVFQFLLKEPRVLRLITQLATAFAGLVSTWSTAKWYVFEHVERRITENLVSVIC